MTSNMTVQDYMSDEMKESSSKFVNKAILLFPKFYSYHWSLYVIFNLNGEDKYEKRSILNFDSDNGEPNIDFIKKLRDWLVSYSIKVKDQINDENYTNQPKKLQVNS